MNFRASAAIFYGLAVSACGGTADTFGSSYDECILKNATSGGDRASRQMSIEICQRRFEKAASREQRAANVLDALQIVDPPLFGTEGQTNRMLINLTNRLPDATITEVMVTAYFWDRPMNEDGSAAPGANQVGSKTWRLTTDIKPGGYRTFYGNFDDGAAPTLNFGGSATVSKAVQLGPG